MQVVKSAAGQINLQLSFPKVTGGYAEWMAEK